MKKVLILLCLIFLCFGCKSKPTIEEFFDSVEYEEPDKWEILLKKGYNINSKYKNGNNAMYMLFTDTLRCLKKYTERDYNRINYLADMNIDVKTVNLEGQTVLHYAAWSGVTEDIKILCEYDVNVNALDNELKTPLHYAIDPICPISEETMIENIEILLNKGANINSRDINGMTPLDYVKIYNDKVKKYLLNKGALFYDDYNFRKSTKLNKITWAYSPYDKDYFKQAEKLIKSKGLINKKDKWGETAIFVAIAKLKYYDIFEYLYNSNSDLEVKNIEGMNLIHILVFNNYELSDDNIFENDENIIKTYKNILNILIATGVNINEKDNLGNTPIFYSKDIYSFNILLENNANLNVKNNNCNSLLHYYVLRNRIELVKILLESNFDLNCQNNEGNTPLHLALERCNKEIIDILLKNGARTDIKNKEGMDVHDLAKFYNIEHLLE